MHKAHESRGSLVETVRDSPLLEDFLPLDAPERQSRAVLPLAAGSQRTIPASWNSGSLVDDIVKELRSFRGPATLQRIFWELLGYQRVAEPLPRGTFSARVRESIQEANLFARHEGVCILNVGLREGRFNHHWRHAILSQVGRRVATAFVLFSDVTLSRVAVCGPLEDEGASPRPLRLWPLRRKERGPLAETLSDLRTFQCDDSPRGTLDLAESVRRLREAGEEISANDLQEPPVDPDRLYHRLFDERSRMTRNEARRLLHVLAELRPDERTGGRREEYLRLRDRLIRANVRLCANVIKQLGVQRKCRSLDWADLMQEAIFG